MPQKHSDVSVAYRVDDAFVVATDTVADPGTADFAAGVGLLLHEAWYCTADVADDRRRPASGVRRAQRGRGGRSARR